MDYVILDTLSLLLCLKLGYTYVTYPGKGFAYTELTLIWWRIRISQSVKPFPMDTKITTDEHIIQVCT